MSKGQGLSINTIIIIAIALIVLIVLVVILTGRVKIFGKGISTCRGVCVTAGTPCDPTQAGVPTPNCKDETQPVIEDGVCCIPII